MDYFANMAARMGYGTPSLAEGTDYQMVRLSNNYWLMLTLYRNHWLARRIVDIPAQDMTRKWANLTCQIDPQAIQQFDRVLAKTYTPQRICQTIKWARLYGGAGALIAIKGHENKLEEPLDYDDVNPGTYLGLIPFDRWVGIWPDSEISDDLDHPIDWGLPKYYNVTSSDASSQTFRVHASRILRFTGPDIPTPEFQAQVYWGISVLELVWEELKKRDNASWSILQLLFRANLIAQTNPELAQLLSGVGMSQQALQQFSSRMQAQNELLSNQSMLVLPEKGQMQAIQYSFAGIGEVYAQFQMDVAGAARSTVTRLFGRTISGLGQSNDQDERMYEEWVHEDQEDQLRPALNKLYPVVCMSVLGEIPDDLDFEFPSVRVLTEEEKSEMTEKASAPIIAAYNSGLISPKIALMEFRSLSDTTGIFTNITDEDIEKADDEPLKMGEGMGGIEGAEKENKPNPQREMKEESGGAEDSAS